MIGEATASARPPASAVPARIPPIVSATPVVTIASAIHGRRPSRVRPNRMVRTATSAGYM
ncbi:MAG TPA: hypothetical protein VEY67_11600 [Candidatus Dormibacteraeota bacterium]|nr:hypothetical protein [Candidatus Dormibacteraeota bacterium]